MAIRKSTYGVEMGHIVKNLSGAQAGKGMYCFSSDLLEGCFAFSRMAEAENDPSQVLHANTATIFFAGSYIEARLNELIEQMSSEIGVDPNIPMAFWEILNDGKKTFSTRDKWNLIASASGGQVWDSSMEPFQALDVVTSLRNEIIHYKGEMGEDGKPRIKKLQPLLDKFRGSGNYVLQSMNVNSWVHDLLTCPALSRWVCEVIEPVAQNFDKLLSGGSPEIMKADPFTR